MAALEKNMLRFLQVNRNRSRDAHNATGWTTQKQNVDVILATEPNTWILENEGGWAKDRGRSNPAIQILDNQKTNVAGYGGDPNFVRVDIAGVRY